MESDRPHHRTPIEVRLQYLPPDDRREVLEAVYLGRAVERIKLAPLALEHASDWQHSGGTRVYRKWYYWLACVIAGALAFVAFGWWAPVIVVVVMTLGPLLYRDRVALAGRAAVLNRELLDRGEQQH